MIYVSSEYLKAFTSPVRQLTLTGYLINAETGNTDVYLTENNISGFTLERIGLEDRFYGYGITQKINIKVLDKYREYNPSTAHYIVLYFGYYDSLGNGKVQRICPDLYITEVRRDEITNELSITAYDKIYQMTKYTVDDCDIIPPMNIAFYITEGLYPLGLGDNSYKFIGDNTPTKLSYPDNANFEGTETLREMYDAIAEATQSIYYIDNTNTLTFKQLDRDGEAVFTISKDLYFTMDNSNNRRLAAICHTTELGDAITASLAESGTTQYIRDNPFYELRTDTHTLLDNALALMGGLTINQFQCEWRGYPYIEIGDKLALITKDNETVYSYLLNDVIEFDGTLRQITQWSYTDDTAETADNPTNLGEALYKTYAKVDKANREIEIVASEAAANKNNIAALQLNTESIIASVSRVETNANAAIDGVNSSIDNLTNRVEAAMTAEGVKLSIQEELANGVNKVYTETGFSFDADGLRVSKTGSEMETLLDEDGLSVFRDNTEVLTADNTGVNGINMTVRQYLIVGGSRFEDYGGRTGCFWIG